MINMPKSQEGASVSAEDRSSSGVRRVFPETDRSLFDPSVQSANRDMFLMTCRIYNAVISDQANQLPRRLSRPDDL